MYDCIEVAVTVDFGSTNEPNLNLAPLKRRHDGLVGPHPAPAIFGESHMVNKGSGARTSRMIARLEEADRPRGMSSLRYTKRKQWQPHSNEGDLAIPISRAAATIITRPR